MKLRVLQGERFSCHSCTNCCRDWHVELMPGEAERIENLNWNTTDPLREARVLLRRSGKTVIAHRPDGACIFLNESNGRCRIHEQFGMDIKPLGCRLFPFQITPTFKGEATVAARYDCPSVRQNIGREYADELPSLKLLADEMGLSEGFDDRTQCFLDREQIEAVCEFVSTLMNGFERGEERALFITLLCDQLAIMQVDQLNRQTLASMFLPLKQQVRAALETARKKPGWLHRMTFRTLLSLYLRRDEDILDGRAGRMGRTLAMIRVVMGVGGFQGLGLSHRKGKLRKARLFKQDAMVTNPAAFAVHWRMIRNKLDSFQFMGKGNNGQDFLNGLRSLALLYPLVLAVAKYSAANRGATLIESDDVDYAVAAIEHSYGRLAILNQPFARNLEKVLMEPNAFARLIRNI